MKQHSYKKTVGLILVIVSLLAGMFFYKPTKVEAGSSGGPNCFILIQSNYYRKTTCPTDASINTTETACYFQPDSAQRAGRTNYTRIDCGTIAQVNTACVNANCYEGATADGTGRPAKNQPSNDPITNEQREELTNCDGRTNPQACLEDNPIFEWTIIAINLLAAGVGIVVTIVLIVGGLQYASAGPNAQAVQAAKKKIANALIALLAFFFMYAFLQWVVPGGIF